MLPPKEVRNPSEYFTHLFLGDVLCPLDTSTYKVQSIAIEPVSWYANSPMYACALLDRGLVKVL